MIIEMIPEKTNGNNHTPKKFLFISEEALIGDLAWTIKQEGHQVKYFIHEKDSKDIADGFVEKADDWQSLKDWADIIIFDDVFFGETAEKLRKEGKAVIGGSIYTDRLEEDREFGQEELRKAGVNVLPHWDFTDFDTATQFVAKNPGRYVLKPTSKDGEKELLFVGQEEDGKDIIQLLEHYKRAWSKKIKSFQLQKYASGVEVAVGAFFNGTEFITPINVNFEHKKMFPGEIGPSTGEMGTLGYFSPPNTIFKETLEKMKTPLQQSGYVGYVDINCIANSRGIHPLEFTCFDEETEIFTKQGWKFFKKLTLGEQVMTINPKTEKLEFQTIRTRIQKFYNGNMIRFGNTNKKHSALDALVTPDHQMLIRDRKNRIKFSRADKIPQGSKIVRIAKWTGKELQKFTLPEYIEQHALGRHKKIMQIKHPKIQIPTDNWLRFLAIYLAEGSNNGYIISISQYSKINDVQNILSKLPFKYSKTKRGFQISSRQLSKYLEQFGTSPTKFVPDYIKNLSKRQIRIFLDTYLLGDGNIHSRTAQKSYYTISKKMADDIQEMLLKCGTVANIFTRKTKGTEITVGNKTYLRKHDGYFISERNTKRDYYVDARSSSSINYSGTVYCTEVPNHTLLVRRHGKAFFAGNCRFGYPTISLHIEGVTSQWGEFLYALATKKPFEFKTKKGFQVCVVIAVPPFPFYDLEAFKKYSEDATILFKKPTTEGIHLGDVKFVDGDWRLAGYSGYALVITGSGQTVEEARKQVYQRVKNIMIPNMFYRTDIGLRWFTDSDKLHTWGYLY